MAESTPSDVTRLLIAWSDGNKGALDQLLPLVYQELRRLARNHMRRERAGHPLQTTALVNEAYIRLIDQRQVKWQNRSHFFAIAAQAMRRILVSMARARFAARRGGMDQPVSLDEAVIFSPDRSAQLVALDEALQSLAVLDARQSRVVELRFFGGLSVEETAHVLGVSAETVMRDWKRAKAWLYRELSGPEVNSKAVRAHEG
ncbi:MAG TPA: sigma-70 family RNA polymerase sigma factor [Bryobacteraceae bacterium]|nr:sigma-70 family RNA polymerase sigma factor [Bryobacteraceae bacterium]